MLWLEVILWATWAMMLAWWPCCCDSESTVTCTQCTDNKGPATVSVTISGSANSACTNCAAMWDGTFITTASVLDGCRGCDGNTPSGTSTCADPTWQICTLAVANIYSNTNHGWKGTFYELCSVSEVPKITSTTWEWDSGGDVAFDCLASQTLTYYAQVPGMFGLACDMSSAGFAINPNG